MLYEGGVRSSLVVWGPGLQASGSAGTTNQQSVFSAIDLVPSLLKITGASFPEMPLDGEALPEVLLGKSQDSRSAPLLFRRPPDRNQFDGDQDLPDLAIRSGDWKLLCEYDGTQTELYDLKNDAEERHNVAEQHGDVVEELKSQILKWHQEMPGDKGETWRRGG